MSATQFMDVLPLDDELAPWKSRIADYFDHSETDEEEEDVPIWDDWGVVEALRRESDEQDHLLSALVRLMETSISGYVEILEFSTDARLRCFAEVVVRQRAAQSEDLRGSIDRERSAAFFQDELIELETAWRLAIWNLEQERQREFLECAERAEALLEDVLLIAAQAIRDEEWTRAMTDHAVMVCGALGVWEELGQTLVDGANQSRLEPLSTAAK